MEGGKMSTQKTPFNLSQSVKDILLVLDVYLDTACMLWERIEPADEEKLRAILRNAYLEGREAGARGGEIT